MNRIATCLALLLAAPLAADVTLETKNTGTGIGALADGTGRTLIQGHRMRTEVVAGKRQLVTIYDLDAQTMTNLEPDKKRAEVIDMRQLASDVQKVVDPDSVKASFEKGSGSRSIAGMSCAEHQVSMRIATTMGEGAPPIETVVSGPVWLAAGVPGQDDFVAFYKAAAEKGFVFEQPEAVKGQPGRAKAMAELSERMAKTGLLCASSLTIGFGCEGPMAAIMGRMKTTLTTEVTAVSTAPLAAELFEIPPGYKLKK
jgi:hypothetical protein